MSKNNQFPSFTNSDFAQRIEEAVNAKETTPSLPFANNDFAQRLDNAPNKTTFLSFTNNDFAQKIHDTVNTTGDTNDS